MDNPTSGSKILSVQPTIGSEAYATVNIDAAEFENGFNRIQVHTLVLLPAAPATHGGGLLTVRGRRVQIYAKLAPTYDNAGSPTVTAALWRLNATDRAQTIGAAPLRAVAVRQPSLRDQWQLLLGE